jgi:hypothetical protein
VTYGGDSGNRIFVLYWRCPLISVSVIRGSTVFRKTLNCQQLALVFLEGTSSKMEYLETLNFFQ